MRPRRAPRNILRRSGSISEIQVRKPVAMSKKMSLNGSAAITRFTNAPPSATRKSPSLPKVLSTTSMKRMNFSFSASPAAQSRKPSENVTSHSVIP